MNKESTEMLQFLGIVIGLFSIFSFVEKGSVVFYFTGIGAIFFSVMCLISFIRLMKSLKKH